MAGKDRAGRALTVRTEISCAWLSIVVDIFPANQRSALDIHESTHDTGDVAQYYARNISSCRFSSTWLVTIIFKFLGPTRLQLGAWSMIHDGPLIY